MLCVVVSCCEKFARDQKCFNNKCCTTEHFFCSQRCCVLFTSFDCSSNFVEFARQRSFAKCSARLTTPHENNMQQMVTKCCVLLGKKFGSFDRGFISKKLYLPVSKFSNGIITSVLNNGRSKAGAVNMSTPPLVIATATDRKSHVLICHHL